MTTTRIEYQLRIRNASNSADALTITSVRSGTNPWLSGAPSGDGQSFDPLTGSADSGAFSGIIVDGITSGTSRVVTSQLEDAGFRQQLMDRRAFVEYRLDGGSWLVLVAGFLTALRLVSGIEYEYTVSEPMRAEREFMAFAPKTDTGNRDNKETVAAFIARWPRRGCIFGGPIMGGFLGRADYGGWEMHVDAVSAGSIFLRFDAGYAAPEFTRSTNAEQCMALANTATDPMFGGAYIVRNSIVTFQDARDGQWPGVVVEIIGTGYYAPYSGLTFPGFNSEGGLNRHLLKDIRMRGVFTLGTPLGVSSTTRRVRAFTAEPSELSPIYLNDHPCDIMASLWTEAGQAYSASAVTACKEKIGAHKRYVDRIPEPQPLADYLARLRAAFGIGVRTNSAGELEMFSSRIFTNTPPTTTITTADVVQDAGSSPAWEIDQSSAIKKIVFEHQRFALTQSNPDDRYAQVLDGIVVSTNIIERTNGDPGAVGNRVQNYRLNGMMTVKDSYEPDTALVDAMALEIFDRYGRGLIRGSVSALRGGSTDSVVLGDEILNNLPRIPNHNKRLGDDLSVAPRAMQVVRSTWTPHGPILVLEDSGPNAQPYATVPTLTIAASAANPKTVAEVTVTNAATLNADSAGLRLQMAVTTGAAPALTDYTDVGAYAAGVIPTVAISLPPLVAGRKVYARAAATKVGARFSAWSTGVSVTLSGVPSVSSLAASAVGTDGSTEQLTWIAGDTTSELDIYLRASGAPAADAIRIEALPPSSTRYLIQGLTPGGAYTAGVQARDAATGDVSAMVDVTFTASVTTVTLIAPVYPWAFAGSLDENGLPQRDGVFGIGVVAAEFPSFVEVAVATESSVGSGSYSSFVTSGTLVASVQADWTKWQDIAPNDGLRRQLKARHVRAGATSSVYTSIVTVLPWTPTALPPFPTNIFLELTQNTLTTLSDRQTKFSVTATVIDPSATPATTKQVRLLSLGASASIFSGAALGTLTASPGTWVFTRPVPFENPALAEFEGVMGDKTARSTIVIPPEGQDGVGNVELSVRPDGSVDLWVNWPSNIQSCRYAYNVGISPAVPSDATARAGTLLNGRTATVNIGVTLALGESIILKAVPYTGTSATGDEGQITTVRAERQNKASVRTGPRLTSNTLMPGAPATDPISYALSACAPNVKTSIVAFGTFVVAPGVTITMWRFRGNRNSGNGVLTAELFRMDSGPTSLGTLTHSTTGAQTVPSSSMTEVATGNSYVVKVTMDTSSATNANDNQFIYAEYDYTSPDLETKV